MTVPRYCFLPYARRGAAAGISHGGSADAGRAKSTIAFAVLLNDEDGTELGKNPKVEVTYEVLGPGNVLGIDATQVVRMVPQPNSHNAEPNYLVHIEFAHPDMPWLFSPEAPDDHNHLTPWINLIVLEEVDGSPLVMRPGSPNPTVRVDPGSLPNLNESWAWAHVQVVTDGSPAELVKDWERNRGRIVSRLVCPRRLEPNRRWLACVVPTFSVGAQAGLHAPGEALDRGASGLTWKVDSAEPVELPVLHHWRFGTGPAGDFETLAQKLKGAVPDGLVGERRVYVDRKLSRLPDQFPFDGKLLSVGTAISQNGQAGPLSLQSKAPDLTRRKAVGTALKELANLSEGNDERGRKRRVVGPPLYGQWHAQKIAIDAAPSGEPVVHPDVPWLAELNTDPEMRVAAALGARVVQQDQEALMAEAWNQLQAISDANRRARWGLVYLSAAVPLHSKRLQLRSAIGILKLTAPVLGRLRLDGPSKTIADRISATALPLSLISANFHRTARYAVRAVERATGLREVTAALQVIDNVADKMLLGKNPAETKRFSLVPRLAPSRFRELFLEDAIAEKIKLATGLSLEDTVRRLETFEATIPTIEQKIDDAREVAHAPDPGIGAALQHQPWVVIEKAPRTGREVATAPGWIVSRGGEGKSAKRQSAVQKLVEVDRERLANIGAIHNEQRQAAPPDAPLFYKKLRLQAGRARRGRDVHLFAGSTENEFRVRNISAEAAKFVVSRTQLDNLRSFLSAATTRNAQRDAREVDALVRYNRLSSVLLSEFNLDRQIDPAMRVDEIGEIGQILPGITTADQAAALPSIVPLSTAQAREMIVTGLEPTKQYLKMLGWALQLTDDTSEPGRPRRRTPAHPIMAAPHFDNPVVEALKRLDAEWVLGHSDRLPPNSISLFVTNARFVEAFLVGANYEMARELRWRRYPTDLMGTSFARFWPTQEDTPDIDPIHCWADLLGRHGPADDLHPDEDVVVVVRGDLLRLYPNTDISAVHGRIEAIHDGQQAPDRRRFIPTPDVPSIRQMFRGSLDPDVTYAGLATTRAKLTEPDRDDGSCWYIALTQPMDEARFGLDEEPPDGPPTPPTGPETLSWQNMAAFLENGNPNLTVKNEIPGWNYDAAKWGPSSDGGQIASILLQQPFQVLLKASDYIVEENS
ncbi:hypothetical protein ILT44_23335 [Microvirga sp. BT689]|uniref:hypothetical protein n=1 Tax=Microvirga arvi TaxID=2778731 RepID=UPI00194F10AC|nr:hypothetical protein [Microvirga arvi]MBM6583139.1 hypothetical protein [Microvirga arvi]